MVPVGAPITMPMTISSPKENKRLVTLPSHSPARLTSPSTLILDSVNCNQWKRQEYALHYVHAMLPSMEG